MKNRIVFAIFLNFICSFITLAGIDAMQLALLKPYQNKTIQRWDNIVDYPLWRSGVTPAYFPQWKLQGVHLKPGQQSRFFLPANQSLRLYHPQQQLLRQHFKVSVSNGSGLWIDTRLQLSDDQHSLLVMPQSSEPLLIAVEPVTDSVQFAAFVSRQVLPGELAPYRTFKWLSGNWAAISDQPLKIPQIYCHLQAHQRHKITLEGPSRLLLKSRLHYEQEAAELFQDYHIRYRLGDKPSKWLNFTTGAESRRLIFVNAQLATLGREQRAFIEIPPGHHQIEFISDRNVYVQLLEQTEQDYLFPDLNVPHLTVQDSRESRQLSNQKLAHMSNLAETTARDNSTRESAMVGQQLLQQAAFQIPEYPAGLKKAKKLAGQTTFYRNLLPAVKNSRQAHFKAYFTQRNLPDPSTYDSDAVLAEQHLADGLKRLPNAVFTPLEAQHNPDRYRLAQRFSPVPLRIIVDQRHCRQQRFKMQMDDRPPLTFNLSCHRQDGQTEHFIESLPEAALVKLTRLGDSETRGIPFSAYREPGIHIPAAVLEIDLPQQIKQISLWRDDSHKIPLNVALQVRASKPFQFSEQSYLARLHDLDRAQQFQLFVNALQSGKKPDTVLEQSIVNQWVPLQRLFKAQYSLYQSAVAKQFPSLRQADAEQLKHWQQQALHHQKLQQWPEALKNLNRIVESSQGLSRDQAQLTQAAMLHQASEHFLARRLWRYLTLYGEASIATQAAERLTLSYQKQHDSQALQRLAIAQFMRSPKQAQLPELMAALLANQQERLVLLLGLMAAPEQVADMMLQAAYRLNWWQTFEHYLAFLPIQERHFWHGLKTQQQGNYSAAQQAWHKMTGDSWRLHLQQALKIRQRLSADADILAIYHDWHTWLNNHPGERVWTNTEKHISDAAGTHQLYSIERDLYSQVYRAEAKRPVTMKILGPVKLNFQIRPLHVREHAASSIDGWLQITDNRDKLLYPVIDNRPSQGLTLAGSEELVPGSLITMDYQVGQGLHEISIHADSVPITLSVEEQRPALPLTVLPPLQIDTFLHAIKANSVTATKRLKDVLPAHASSSLAIADQPLSVQQLLNLDQVTDSEQATQRMMHYLAAFERQIQHRAQILGMAEQLQLRYGEDDRVRAIWLKMARYSEWQPIGTVAGSAGLRFQESQGWQPASPELRIRQALLSGDDKDEHVVTSNQRLLVSINNRQDQALQVEARVDTVAFLAPFPLQFFYQIDDLEPEKVTIQRDEAWHKLQLKIAAGTHQLRFFLAQPVSNQFLKLRFHDPVADMSARQEKTFFVSQAASPLQFYVNGPAQIRIDEWRDGQIQSRLQDVATGWQRLSIPPSSGQQESLLQIKQRKLNDKPRPVNKRTIQRNITPVTLAKYQVATTALPETITIDDFFTLGGQEDGTWSFATESVRRNNLQEDFTQSNPEHFQEFNISHRYFDAYKNWYWRSEGFARLREHGEPSFGFKESLLIKPDQWPFSFNIETSVVSQEIADTQEWAGLLKMSLSQTAQLFPKTRITPKLSWFGRYLSLRDSDNIEKDGPPKDKQLIAKLDQNLYTAYKAQHSTGMSAAIQLTHSPWLDTQWQAKFKTASNENLIIFNPDYFSTELHWLQLLGDFSVDAGYRVNFFQQDHDRTASSIRQFTRLELNWQGWTKKLNRVEINGTYNYDIDRKAHLGMLNFTYHFGVGRGYRDFKPGEVDFPQIRYRNALHD